METKIVVVRAEVLDKKVWSKGTEAETRCRQVAAESFARLPATEPYTLNECEGLFVRGLAAKDFHILVDGLEQKIQSVTTEKWYIPVRDNRNFHVEYSHSPVGIWSTSDFYTWELVEGNGLEAMSQYDLSFAPGKSDPPGCHEIKVTVDRRNSIVHARTQYCDSESPSDTLNDSTFGKQLERDLASGDAGNMTVSLQASVFYTGTERGRTRIVLEFPWDSLRRQWKQDWTLDASIGLLGMVYKEDGTLASRFSDLGCCTAYWTNFVIGNRGETLEHFLDSIEKLGLSLNPSMMLNGLERGILPTRYETHLDLPPGEYDLRIVLSDGEKFGRAQAHINIENHDGNALTLSSVMLCKRFRDAHVAEIETKAANFAPQYVPLVSKGIRVTPAGDTNLKPGEPLIPYFEIYAPQVAGKPAPQTQAHLRIVDARNGAVIKEFPPLDAALYAQPGSSTIPIAREVPIAALPKGEYRLEVQASDSTGRTTPWRSANFSIVGTD